MCTHQEAEKEIPQAMAGKVPGHLAWRIGSDSVLVQILWKEVLQEFGSRLLKDRAYCAIDLPSRLPKNRTIVMLQIETVLWCWCSLLHTWPFSLVAGGCVVQLFRVVNLLRPVF